MKFSISWLKEYLDTSADIEKIVNTLNKIGLEVDSVDNKGKNLDRFNCVYVEECKKHPDSDHLNLCKVKVKDKEELLNIVCGAPNVRAGMKAILAPDGSVLPSGVKIEKTKIRGAESNGMLCSKKELGIGEDHEGIYEVNKEVELGTNIADILNLNDPIIDVDLTPNKGDCLGVYGIARDLACAGLGRLKSYSDFSCKINNDFDTSIKINVEDSNCPVFFCREIKNLKNCESPDWLKNKLKICDINPKNALVDITNYVMLSFNKPLHCYDKTKVEGNINVKSSTKNEEFIDLFDRKFNLPEGATLICDSEKILCLGGIIGAKASGSSLETTNVIVESAIFDAINTAKTGRKLNLQTDSRYRFERGSDYDVVEFALNYACKLILDICGGEVSDIIKYEKENYKTTISKKFELDFNYLNKLIGINFDKQKVLTILENYGYKVNESGDILNISVPFYKNNILVKEDIIDDIVRIYGYDKLDNGGFTDVKMFEKDGNSYVKGFERKMYQIRQNLIENGLVELISYSFLDKKDDEFFAESSDELDLINPIISDFSHMRQSLLTNMMRIIKRNVNRDFHNLSFFEIGKIFTRCKIDSEINIVAGVRYGNNCNKNIYEKTRSFDVFDVKKDLFDVLEVFGINGDKIPITKETPKYYHPNRSGALVMGKNIIGYFGELHPEITEHFDLKNRLVAFEVLLDKLPKKLFLDEKIKSGFKPNDLQIIDRDLSFIVDKNIEVGNLIKEIYGINKEFIQDVSIFDIYEKFGESTKSVAFNIKIQPKQETMDKQQIDEIINEIIDLLNKKYNCILRDK